MKILIDMNLPPKWAGVFVSEGWEALHWSKVGEFDAADKDIMKWAKDHGFLVFTHDLDFGSILAGTSADAPSVIQVRTQDVMPESIGTIVVNAIKKFSDELNDGALISIDHHKARARLLPLRRQHGIPAAKFYRAVAFAAGFSKTWKVDFVDGNDCSETISEVIQKEGVEL